MLLGVAPAVLLAQRLRVYRFSTSTVCVCVCVCVCVFWADTGVRGFSFQFKSGKKRKTKMRRVASFGPTANSHKKQASWHVFLLDTLPVIRRTDASLCLHGFLPCTQNPYTSALEGLGVLP